MRIRYTVRDSRKNSHWNSKYLDTWLSRTFINGHAAYLEGFSRALDLINWLGKRKERNFLFDNIYICIFWRKKRNFILFSRTHENPNSSKSFDSPENFRRWLFRFRISRFATCKTHPGTRADSAYNCGTCPSRKFYFVPFEISAPPPGSLPRSGLICLAAVWKPDGFSFLLFLFFLFSFSNFRPPRTFGRQRNVPRFEVESLEFSDTSGIFRDDFRVGIPSRVPPNGARNRMRGMWHGTRNFLHLEILQVRGFRLPGPLIGAENCPFFSFSHREIFAQRNRQCTLQTESWLKLFSG